MAASHKKRFQRKPQNRLNNTGLSLSFEPTPAPATFFEKLQKRDGLGQCVVADQSFSCTDDTFEPFIKTIGSGQYGVVYKVKHNPSTVYMAIKEVNVVTTDPKSHEHLLNDLDVVQAANHDNIVKFFGFDYYKDTLRIMLECAISDWRNMVDKAASANSSVPERVLARFAHSVTSGLVYLQEELHTMHRDIKPSNVLLTACGRIKLCDFGICKVATEPAHLQSVMTVVGCNNYLPPERIHGTGAYDSRSDVWSLGVTLLQLTTLDDFPFPDSKPCSQWKLMEFLKEDPKLAESIPDHISTPMRAYIGSCLMYKCESRPQVTPDLLEHECFQETVEDGVVTSNMADCEEVLTWAQALIEDDAA